LGWIGGENVASHQRNGERLQSPVHPLFITYLCAMGSPQWRAIPTFEQAGRDFKKLLI
jgi:hypothetical protein